MSGPNPWLNRQRKSDLVGLAEHIGLDHYEDLKKSELELTLDEYLGENAAQFQHDPKLSSYFQSRARTIGSPIKKEVPDTKPIKRRSTKASQDLIPAPDADDGSLSPAAVHTPGRTLSQVASRISLPASPADVADAVDRSTLVLRERAASLYKDSGVTDVTRATRESLSTVHSVLLSVAAFELYFLRREVLADRYAFTVPAVDFLGTPDYPVHVPDMFLLLTSSFWSPALTWLLTSTLLPALFGYFFNLSAAGNSSGTSSRSRSRVPASLEYAIDPLTFSIIKALVTYVIYSQGVTLGGWIDQLSVARINSAVYGGWKGVLVGAGVSGLMSIYEAALRK